MSNDLITHPSSVMPCPDYPVIQFVDDTILVMSAVESQLSQVMNLIRHFVSRTGLTIKCSKSVMVPHNMSDDKTHRLVTILGC